IEPYLSAGREIDRVFFTGSRQAVGSVRLSVQEQIVVRRGVKEVEGIGNGPGAANHARGSFAPTQMLLVKARRRATREDVPPESLHAVLIGTEEAATGAVDLHVRHRPGCAGQPGTNA